MMLHGYKQIEISQELSMGTEIFKKIKILMTVPL
jgi:hypothetical protein